MPTFLKPAWISHQGTPIYSIDIHPNGSRIATGGGDNKVKIWNTEPVRSEENEKDKSVPKLLASMGMHLNAVNSVRWSHKGQHLASGSDDKTAFIWERTTGGSISNVFGEQDSVVEVWKPIWALKGHDSDVLDVQWSPDDSLLATAGVDNYICIWNVSTGAKVVKLKGHKGIVKGLTWDPVGKYLASQSDDKTVIIWRTFDWQKETVIEEFYKKNTEKDFYRRLSWSPDGSLIATTNAFANDAPVSAIIERDKWSKNVDFVGHTKPIAAARFSNVMFEVTTKKKRSMKYCCCALGSMDKGISVWATNSSRPIFVAANAFQDTVLDLSWAGDGRTLVACSMDGTIAFVEFTTDEIGVPMSKERQRKVMIESYGLLYSDGKTKSLFSKNALIESPDQLQLETSKLPTGVHTFSNSTATTVLPEVLSSSAPQSSNLPQALSEQKETRTSDGRRRIQPVVLSPSSAPIRTNSLSVSSFQSLETETPVPILAPERSPSPPPLDVHHDGATSSVKRKRTSTPPVQQPKKAKSKHSHDNRKEKQTSTASRDSNKRDKDRTESTRDRSSSSDKTKETPAERISGAIAQRSVVRLPAAELKDGKLTTKLKTKRGEGFESYLEATYTSVDSITHIRLIIDEQPQWEDHIRGKACVLTGNDSFSAIGCSDGSIQIYSPFGRRLLPALNNGYPLSCLDTNDTHHLMAVTTDATVYVWNISELKSTLISSLGALVDPPLTIVRTKITEDGVPVVQLSNYEAYVFNESMKSWLRIADNKFTGSEYNTLISRIGNEDQRSLSLLRQLQEQSGKRSELAAVSRMTPKQHALETRAHLENQMGCALALKSSSEYLTWSEKYVQSLVESGDSQRLGEFCSFLASSAALGTAATDFMGISRKEIVRLFRGKIEPLIASNRSLQRIREKFRDIFQDLENAQKTQEDTLLDALKDA